TVALFAPSTNGTIVKDTVTFGLQLRDLSIGRVGGTNGWGLNSPTPGTVNLAAGLGDPNRLKINEWMASPPTGSDWFEIYNPEVSPVSLAGLYLTDTLTEPTNTALPELSYIGATGFALFEADGKPGKGANHVNFKLSSTGDSIALYDHALRQIDAVTFGIQT